MAASNFDLRAPGVDPFVAQIPDPATYERLAEMLHAIDGEFMGRDLTEAEEERWFALRAPVLADLRATMSWPVPLPLVTRALVDA